MSPMDPIIVGLIGIGIFLLIMAMGMPIGFSMALVGFVGIAYLISVESAFGKLAIVPFRVVANYEFTVIPLFIFMANICFQAGLGRDLFDLAFKWLGPFPGGLAMGTVVACAIFSAISGSSIGTAVTVGLVALTEMKKYNYAPKLATGCVAAGGTMGVLIPPSNPLILYGIITEQSIGKLFIAGIIPGILEAVFYIITIYIICRLNPNLGPRSPKVSFKEKLAPIGRCGEVVLLVVFVLGGLFIGWFTPTEAGAAGAFGSIVIALARRRLDWRKFKEACLETLRTSGMIYALIIGASIMNYFLAVSRLPTEVARVIGDLPLPPIGIMALVMSLQIVLGCFIDALAMMLILTPIFFPMAMQLGFDPIWFGIMMVVMGEIAVITPPVGINVYAISGIAKDVPMETIFRGIFPFFIADICRVALLLFVPQLALFLPSLMK